MCSGTAFKCLAATIKGPEGLHNPKEVDGKDVEDLMNVPNARIISVVRTGWGSEGIVGMLGEVNQALSPLAHFIDNEKYANIILRGCRFQFTLPSIGLVN